MVQEQKTWAIYGIDGEKITTVTGGILNATDTVILIQDGVGGPARAVMSVENISAVVLRTDGAEK